MNDSGLFVKLEPKQVEGAVDIAIRAALAEVMGRDPDALVKAVVNAALSEKRDGGYGPKGTLFAKAIDKLVQDEATAAVGEIIEGQRERIRGLLVDRLTRELDPAKLAGTYADALIAAIDASMYVSVNLSIHPATAPDADR
jgi:hypothetical protein